MCTRKFISGCDIRLADRNMGLLILHYDLIYCAILIDCKGDVFGICEAIRCSGLCHRVAFSRIQNACDHMRLVRGIPLIDRLSVFVLYNNVCAR